MVEESRETIAAALGCRPGEVVFTSGGTESDNLAVKGLYWARRDRDPRRTRVLATAVEHHAVLDPLHWLAEHEQRRGRAAAGGRAGAGSTSRPCAGAVERDPESVALVSVMWANNEVGTVQPVAEVVEIAHAHDIPVHTDAVQAVGPGAGRLRRLRRGRADPDRAQGRRPLRRRARSSYAATSRSPRSCTAAGRSATSAPAPIDAPAIAGFAAAVELAVRRQPEHAARVAALRDDLVRRVREQVPDAALNGDPDSGLAHRLPGNAHLTFPGCEGDSLLMLLDARGIASLDGVGLLGRGPQPSHVLLAMGCDQEQARSSLRLSLGHTSTAADVDALVEAIGPVVERARAAGAGGRARPCSKRAG